VGVSGEEAGVSNVVEVAVKENNSLETDSTSTMRISTISHGINVILKKGRVESTFNDSLGEGSRVVVSLST
jgi:hypothetical protein